MKFVTKPHGRLLGPGEAYVEALKAWTSDPCDGPELVRDLVAAEALEARLHRGRLRLRPTEDAGRRGWEPGAFGGKNGSIFAPWTTQLRRLGGVVWFSFSGGTSRDPASVSRAEREAREAELLREAQEIVRLIDRLERIGSPWFQATRREAVRRLCKIDRLLGT